MSKFGGIRLILKEITINNKMKSYIILVCLMKLLYLVRIECTFCYKASYGRGAGSPLSRCADDNEKNGALCYPLCKSGYTGAGPVCWEDCREGYDNHGATCCTYIKRHFKTYNKKFTVLILNFS